MPITDSALKVPVGQIQHPDFESEVRFDLKVDLQGQIKGQRTENAQETKDTGRIAFFRHQNRHKVAEQVSQSFQ